MLARKSRRNSKSVAKATRVFISYAHETAVIDKKILDLADLLRGNGVDARIDRYEPHPSQGWPRWMEEQLASAHKVIVIPSKKYLARYNQDSGVGSGARFETSILRSQLMKNGVSYERIAVALLKPGNESYIPDLLHGCQRYAISTKKDFENLYRWLTNQSAPTRPKLGALKLLPKAQSSFTTHITNFRLLCRALQPILDDNRRLFRDFGPNSSANSKGPVRYNLASWYTLRKTKIVPNNSQLRDLIVDHQGLIPKKRKAIFDRLISHIDAFEAHVEDDAVDYREHQFPAEIESVINANV
jgi:TIR domain